MNLPLLPLHACTIVKFFEQDEEFPEICSSTTIDTRRTIPPSLPHLVNIPGDATPHYTLVLCARALLSRLPLAFLGSSSPAVGICLLSPAPTRPPVTKNRARRRSLS